MAFKKGNKDGKKFQPGQSGNPAGRSKKLLVDEILEELLTEKNSARARKIALKLVEKAEKGDLRAIQLLAERTQGKPRQAISFVNPDELPELDFGDLPMPAGFKSGTAGKPN